MEFVHHSNTQQLMEALDTAVKKRWVRLLTGERETGKSYLLETWAASGSKIVRSREVIKIDLWNSELEVWGAEDGAYASACMTFSLLWGELAQRRISLGAFDTPSVLAKPKTMYKRSQFASLFRIVKDAVAEMRPRAIIIDNATYLDTFALDRLLDVRNKRFPLCALILCARQEKHATPDEPFRELFRTSAAENGAMTDAEAMYIPEVLRLQQLEELEFYEVVADRLLKSFNAELPDAFVVALLESDVLEQMWKKINKDWRVMARIETLIDFKLGPAPRQRVMTLDVINWALDQLS